MKKVTTLFLCLCLILPLVACSEKPPLESDPKGSEQASTPAPEEPASEDSGKDKDKEEGKSEKADKDEGDKDVNVASPDEVQYVDDGVFLVHPGVRVMSEQISETNPFGVALPMDFSPVKVVDIEDFTVTVTGIEMRYKAVVLNLELQNKSKESNIRVEATDATVDQVRCWPNVLRTVPAGETIEEKFELVCGDYFTYGSTRVTDLHLHLNLRDADDYSIDPIFDDWVHIYPFGEDKVEPFVRRKQPHEQVFLDNDDVHVDLLGYKMQVVLSPRIVFYLQNKAQVPWTFTFGSAKLNGQELDPMNTTRTVQPGTSSFMVIEWDESYMHYLKIKEVDTIELTLSVSEDPDKEASYEEVFKAKK